MCLVESTGTRGMKGGPRGGNRHEGEGAGADPGGVTGGS